MKKNNLKKSKTFIIEDRTNQTDDLKTIYYFLSQIRHIQISEKESAQLKYEIKNQKIEVDVPIDFLKRKVDIQKIDFELTSQTVLYEDDGLIAVNKPSGIPSQATLDPRRDHLYAAVQRWVKKEAFLHHRLDLETSGIVLFVKKRSLNKSIGDMFEHKTIQKTYLAIVTAKTNLDTSFTIDNSLAKIQQKTLKVQSVKSGGEPAKTHFETMDCNQKLAIIKACPITGRTHQIRVHLSEYGCPIIGDKIYQGDLALADRTMLHAFQLEFIHPITNLKLCLRAPLPPDFEHCLRSFSTIEV